MAWLWLLAPNSTANATSGAISNAPSGSGWLSSLQHSVATAAGGYGLPIAIALAGASAAIAVTVAMNWHPRTFLALGVVLNLAYWVLGQGFGGILTGSGTDPNAGPLFILLAFGMYSLVGIDEPAVRRRHQESARPRLSSKPGSEPLDDCGSGVHRGLRTAATATH
jgi:hypothetical protein